MTDAPPFPPGSFMADLPAGAHVELLREARTMALPAGATLLFEGDLSGRVVVVLGGAVRVFVTAANGREVFLTVAGAGEILGEMSAVDGWPHSASVTALEHTEVALIPAERFADEMRQNAAVSFAVARRLTRELRRVMQERVGLEAFDVPTRLARTIVDLVERLDVRDGPTELPVSQHELADACGASREAVTKALSTFRSRGWIRTDRRSIVVLDLDALRARGS